MTKYRLRDSGVDAFQMTKKQRNNFGPFPDWAIGSLIGGRTGKMVNSEWVSLITPNNEIQIMDGDWVVKSEDGRIWTCSSEFFDVSYEPIIGKPKYSVGDEVKIKSDLTDVLNSHVLYLRNDNDGIEVYLGEVGVIEQIVWDDKHHYFRYMIDVDFGDFWWIDECFVDK